MAKASDVAAIEDVIARAFALYIPRIGRRPAPMDGDHAARVAAGQAFVATSDETVTGVVVLVAEPDHVHIDTVAVDPDCQGTGVGRALLTHAEDEARRLAVPEVRLSTNAKMTENLALYPRAGYDQTGRTTVNGFDRVHFRKSISGAGAR